MERIEAIKELIMEAMKKTVEQTSTEDLAQMSWFCTEEEAFEQERSEAA